MNRARDSVFISIFIIRVSLGFTQQPKVTDWKNVLRVDSSDGFYRYKREFVYFKTIGIDRNLKSIPGNMLAAFAEDIKEQLYFVYEKAIYKFSQVETHFTRVIEFYQGRILNFILNFQNNRCFASDFSVKLLEAHNPNS